MLCLKKMRKLNKKYNQFRFESLESRCLLSDISSGKILDSDLEWSTYLGGMEEDWARDVVVDKQGNIYTTGNTYSSNWNSDKFLNYYGGNGDAFVTKLNSKGEHIWSKYLGGSNDDSGNGITVDNLENIYVTGSTSSTGWISGGFDTQLDGIKDVFVSKINSNGENVWSTYLGGSKYESGNAIDIDNFGNVYITGFTGSENWIFNGFDNSYNGNGDAFLTKINSRGEYLWSTYLGGSNEDYGKGIALDNFGNIYVTGSTSSSGWVSGSLDAKLDGAADGFIVKINSKGEHVWSTYLGGERVDMANAIALDTSKNILVAGETSSPNWVSGGFDQIHNGYYDGFLAKISPLGENIWSTYIGKDWTTKVLGISVDSSDNVFITGWAPLGISADIENIHQGENTFLLGINSSGNVLGYTYLGAKTADDDSWGMAMDISSLGEIYVVGSTANRVGAADIMDWASNGFDTTYGGRRDGFAVKINNIASPGITLTNLKTPVIIIPGILGSMPEGHSTILPTFYSRDLTRFIRNVLVENKKVAIRSYQPSELIAEQLKKTYNGITEAFVNQGYSFCDLDNPNLENDSVNCDNANLFFAAYDWRLPVLLNPDNPQEILWDSDDNTFQSGAEYLDWWINLAKQKWLNNGGSENDFSVNIVAHSIGGLIARAYIEEADEAGHNAEKVDSLIMLGTPNHGSVSSYQFSDPINRKFVTGKLNYIDSIFNHYLRLILRSSVSSIERSYRLPRGSVKSEDILPSLKDLLPTFPFIRTKNDVIMPQDNNLLTRLNETIDDLTNATDVLLIGNKDIETPVRANLRGNTLKFETVMLGDGVVLYDKVPENNSFVGLLLPDIEAVEVLGVRHSNLPGDQTVINRIFDEILIGG